MKNGLEIICNYFFKPRWSIRKVTEYKSLHLGLIVLMLVIISTSIANNLMFNMGGKVLGFQLTLLFVARLVFKTMLIFLLAAFYHFVACSLGTNSNSRSLFTLLSLANIPFLLSVPLALIMYKAGDTGKGWYSFTLFLLLVWYAYFVIISLQEKYNFSVKKAFFTFILCSMLKFFLLFLILVGIPISFIIRLITMY